MKEKTLLLPLSLVEDLYRYVHSPEEYAQLQDELCRKLEEKKQAYIRRELFSEYKTARAGSDEREHYRKEYLERSNITAGFRSGNETPNK